jgi:uncharacterized membrane protein
LAHRNTQIIAAAQSYSGPLPSAEQLIKYKEAQSDAPERIISMAEHQAQHRQGIEAKVISCDNFRATLGLCFAFVIVLATIYVSWNLITAGHEASGLGLFGATLVSVVTSFIYGSKVKRSSREPKPS